MADIKGIHKKRSLIFLISRMRKGKPMTDIAFFLFNEILDNRLLRANKTEVPSNTFGAVKISCLQKVQQKNLKTLD